MAINESFVPRKRVLYCWITAEYGNVFSVGGCYADATTFRAGEHLSRAEAEEMYRRINETAQIPRW